MVTGGVEVSAAGVIVKQFVLFQLNFLRGFDPAFLTSSAVESN